MANGSFVDPWVGAPQVFVSKASEDGVVAMRAVALLERAGFRTWISERDIPAGADHAVAVPPAVRASRVMILLLSAHAVTSPWVLREFEVAISAGVQVVPVAMPGFAGVESLPDAWQFRLIGSQVRVDGDLEAAVDRIAVELRDHPHSSRWSHSPPSAARSPRTVTEDDLAEHHPLRVASATAHGFVGRERHQILDELTSTWQQVSSTRSARVVVLLAETGFGKTRIVQEFYRRLAANQSEPTFWPADIVDATSNGQRALRESRKRVAPLELSPHEGSSASYLWLGHVIDEGHGGRVDVGLEHLGEDLGRALSLAAAVQPGGPGARMVARALACTPTPGSDTRVALTELLHRGTPIEGHAVAPSSVEAFWQGVRALWSGADDSLPTIIVVEDGHFTGQETSSALDQLATSAGLPLLIVICAQESQLGGDTVTGSAQGGSRRPLGRLVDQRLPSLTVRRLIRLEDSDVRSLFLESIPDLEAETVQEAVRKVDGNPYHAHTLLVEMVRAAEHGRLGVDWVRGRPGTFEGELRQQWQLLPDDVRRLLSGIAVLGTQVPERIGLHAMRAVYGADPQADVDASLKSGWLRRLATDEALRFLERPRWLIANSESVEEWHPAQRRQIIEEALGTLESLAADSGGLADPLLQELHLALALTADRGGISFQRVAAIRSGLAGTLRLRLVDDDPGSLAVAQETESLVAGHETEPGMAVLAVEAALALEVALGTSLPQGGTAARTVEAAELAVRRAQAVEARRPDLAARAYSALCRTNRVRFDVARLRIAAQALVQAEQRLAESMAPDAQTRAEVLHAQAMMAKARGDNRVGAEFADRRLGLLQGAYGSLDRRVVVALLNTAYYWNRIDVQRALQLRLDLLDRRTRIWGDRSNASVAIAEKEIAFTLVRMPAQDRLEEAHASASRALSSLVATRGAHHNQTLMARTVWCFVSSRLSDAMEATAALDRAAGLRRQALAAARENLEHTRPDARLSTLVIRRRRVAELLVRLGHEEGVDWLTQILQTEIENRLDGPDEAVEDIEVLWTVAELVAGMWRLGRENEALALAAQYPIEREERWPAFQPRGWRSTRPQDAQAGVL
ncbi:MAG: toll/interleukin-1 receptor domain-containing protein [Candidatus Nanopelagicales bacterium]